METPRHGNPYHRTVVRLRQPDEIDDPMTEVLRVGARRLLAQAIEIEAEAFLATMQDLRLPDGRASSRELARRFDPAQPDYHARAPWRTRL